MASGARRTTEAERGPDRMAGRVADETVGT